MPNESGRTPEELAEYLRLQKEEMFGPHNRFLAGEKLGHSPNDSEAVTHYINNGGAEDFARRHREHTAQ